MNDTGEKTVPCETCGEPTTKTGTKRCDWCWEVESRLDGYLTRGKANARRILLATLKGCDPEEIAVRTLSMTVEEARLPRKIVQLVTAGAANGTRLFCLCDDGTSWEFGAQDHKPRWKLLPKPGLPALVETPP